MKKLFLLSLALSSLTAQGQSPSSASSVDETSAAQSTPKGFAEPAVRILAALPIDRYLSPDLDPYHPHVHITFPKEADGTTGLLLSYSGPPSVSDHDEYRTQLLSLPGELFKLITGDCYGISGMVSYSDVDPSLPIHPNTDMFNGNHSLGVLGMASMFAREGLTAPNDDWYQNMEGERWGGKDSNMGLMRGSRDWGNFYLGFNRKHISGTLKGLELYLVMGRAGTVHLRDLKLVQYPDLPTAPAMPAPAISTGKDRPIEAILHLNKNGGILRLSMGGVNYDSIESFKSALSNIAQTQSPSTVVIFRAEHEVDSSTMKTLRDASTQAGFPHGEFTWPSPSTSSPAPAISSVTSQKNLNWKSFWFGVLATAGTLIVSAVLFALGSRFRRLRHARELRRIASLDT